MASYNWQRPMTGLLFFLLSLSGAGAQKPRAFVVPVSKDSATGQYVAQLRQRTPLVPVPAVVDLGGSFFYVNCERGFVSSSYRRVRCGSAQCAASRCASCCSCINGATCGFDPDNPFQRNNTVVFSGEVSEDVLVVQSTDGSNPGPPAAAGRTVFGCVPRGRLGGLAKGVKGIAGLGRNLAALPSQLAANFNLPRRFALCLSTSVGVAFFGSGPYQMQLDKNISSSLLYTPLLVNPKCIKGTCYAGEPSDEHFIGVTGLRVNGKRVVGFDTTLLKIDTKTGRGGTRLSTAEPYTALESSIFRAVVDAFARERGFRSLPAVKPFGFCFDSSRLGSTRVGPPVPQIDLVLQNEVAWSWYGASTVVEVKPGVSCLAFVDSGPNSVSSIVIGGYQLENHLLEFDLDASQLGFSFILLGLQTTCGNFNFTSTSA